MSLHPDAERLVALMEEAGLGFGPESTPESMRAAMNAAAVIDRDRVHPVHAVDDRAIDGPAGPIPLRVYRPRAGAGLPVLMWFHGGGWVVGSLDMYDHLCRLLCDAADAIVVSVDYRLAPETKFPGAVDDCLAAWSWLRANARDLGGDPARLALGGDSAGGNLAAVVALTARAEATAPALQLLVYPVTDYEFERPSMVDNATGYFLQTEQMRWFFHQYGRTAEDFADWRMSPLRVPDPAGAAPALVITAEYDPLRDQGEAYAARLADAGVPTRLVRGDRLFHGYFGMYEFLEPARPSWDIAVRALRDAFDGKG